MGDQHTTLLKMGVTIYGRQPLIWPNIVFVYLWDKWLLMVHLRTRQTSSFVYMFDSLGEIVTEAVLCFQKEGLYLRETAYAMSVLVTAQLDARRFDEYEIDDEDGIMCILVSMNLLCGLLRTANITDALSITLIERSDLDMGGGGVGAMTMEICLCASTGGTHRTYCLPVHRIAPDDARCHARQNPGVEKQFDHVLHINTKHLTHMCTNVFPFSSVVMIEVDGSRVSFTVESNESLVSRARITLGGGLCQKRDSEDGLTTEHRGQKRAHTPCAVVNARFSTQKLALFAKALALHPVCNMYLAEDYPLVIEILINQLGKMRLCLMHLAEIDPVNSIDT
jgi:hypothetical protein